jgi:hypothetical protein
MIDNLRPLTQAAVTFLPESNGCTIRPAHERIGSYLRSGFCLNPFLERHPRRCRLEPQLIVELEHRVVFFVVSLDRLIPVRLCPSDRTHFQRRCNASSTIFSPGTGKTGMDHAGWLAAPEVGRTNIVFPIESNKESIQSDRRRFDNIRYPSFKRL